MAFGLSEPIRIAWLAKASICIESSNLPPSEAEGSLRSGLAHTTPIADLAAVRHGRPRVKAAHQLGPPDPLHQSTPGPAEPQAIPPPERTADHCKPKSTTQGSESP